MKKLIILILLLLCLTANVSHSQSFKMFGQLLSGQYAEGLVFYWRGIEAVEVVDESLYGNHGTITGATWVGQGLNFNGSSDSVALSMSYPAGSFTFIFHAKTTDTWKDNYFIDIQTGRLIIAWNTNSGDQLGYYDGAWHHGPEPPGDGYWHTLAYVMDSVASTGTIYLDGVSVYSDTYAAKAIGGSIAIGSRYSQNANFFDVTIGYAIIYTRALSASEIAVLYLNPALPMQQPSIWLFQPPPAVVTGQVIIITKHEKKSTIMSILSSLWEGIWALV